ncbi:MAG: BglII/BstYI family type II restriction endonuclease [Chloroflexi bacterium]|nr:BglII/BstYI family type II restriction endonuclease [Chloroflexota bacterium]
MPLIKHIPTDLQGLYEIHDYRHAAAILATDFAPEFKEICNALRQFRLTKNDILRPGGNESEIPKKFSALLRPTWKESQLNAKLIVNDDEIISHDTHKIDYLKGRVALDIEWNSKDQTFDRDLYAFRTFFEYNKISVGILITRSNELDPWFVELGSFIDAYGVKRDIKDKYGASTTHMGKLIPRLEAGRNGGCPILVFGITPKLIEG